MKYIVLQHPDTKEETIHTWPDRIDMTHQRMSEVITAVRVDKGMSSWDRAYLGSEIVGAGFCNSTGCFGRSESLNVDSRPEQDTELLRKNGMIV
jgi:hypothetical protein